MISKHLRYPFIFPSSEIRLMRFGGLSMNIVVFSKQIMLHIIAIKSNIVFVFFYSYMKHVYNIPSQTDAANFFTAQLSKYNILCTGNLF